MDPPYRGDYNSITKKIARSVELADILLGLVVLAIGAVVTDAVNHYMDKFHK